ncbi:MAG: hypothetical protein NC328_04410 [Muribaculum sp.]|nr:hypothetical protein [Muribaculum sp.]
MNKVKTILISLLMLLPIAVFGQDWIEKAPGKYLQSATQQIVNRESVCNQGDEAFMDFIPKFRSDTSFRKSRTKFNTEEFEFMPMWFESLREWNNGNGYALFKAKKTKNLFCTWHSVSANEVCFEMQEETEWSGSSMHARFQRIDGKWYITDFFAAG